MSSAGSAVSKVYILLVGCFWQQLQCWIPAFALGLFCQPVEDTAESETGHLHPNSVTPDGIES